MAVKLEVFRAVMEIHDAEKILLFPLLCAVKHLNGVGLARDVYDLMNALGKQLKNNKIQSLEKEYEVCLTSKSISDIDRFERVIDCLDRNQDPEFEWEFGKPNEPLSKFLTPEELLLADKILKIILESRKIYK